MADNSEFGSIFKDLLIDLKENFDEDFTKQKLYKNVARLERKTKKIDRKINDKFNFKEACEKSLVAYEKLVNPETDAVLDEKMDEEVTNKIRDLISNGRIIEKLNEDIIAKSTQLKLINEKFFDIKSSVELLENDDDCLKNVDSNLKKWQETLNN